MVEYFAQPTTPSIETVTFKPKTSPCLTIGAAYALPGNKISQAELDEITNRSRTKYYLRGGDFNAKH